VNYFLKQIVVIIILDNYRTYADHVYASLKSFEDNYLNLEL